MNFSRLSLVVLATLVSGPAFAAAPEQPMLSAPSPAGTTLGGPAIPGVCYLSRDAVLTNSKVGLYATERLKQITAAAQAEVTADRKPVDAEIATLRGQVGKISENQLRARDKTLGEKLAAIKGKADLRTREIEQTRTKAIEGIFGEVQPVIVSVYTQHGCGILLDRKMVLGGNLTNDLTAQVVAGLDARLTTLPVEKVILPEAVRPN
ncbi:outer membrane chaperone Skp (OmpH) [Novosphingobium nitrogenifigens DSM 19370]|uniref:Outer membrane chaperone Skp (OmpH) n=2 Tax=Novosphingobium nitrogenifigens TaxID=378548 RepID=F1ZBF3_9SPHN|nr:OmpH family outer membrane protein [Novosphingobium nitrogenifigens]EGD58149.1 outer membrane chaperone Skp (OmpH) [Novosphingobium nitrogenifigens DSM 19370]